jgi:hypothetical protein
LERQIAMNSLAAAIRAIANEPAVASRPSTLTSRPAEPATAASSAESAASTSTAESTTAPGTTSAWTTRTGTSRSTGDTARLACNSRSRQSTGRLHPEHRPPQTEIVLAGLQSIADRSVYQKSFVGVRRRRLSHVLRRGRCQLV